MNINRVVLTGNLTRDPELRQTTNSSVCDLGLGVNEQEKINGEWQDRANFFTITAWGAIAENAAKYLHKGSPIAVEGRLRYESWEKDGQKRSAVKVVASAIQYLEGRKAESNGAPPEDVADDDIPF